MAAVNLLDLYWSLSIDYLRAWTKIIFLFQIFMQLVKTTLRVHQSIRCLHLSPAILQRSEDVIKLNDPEKIGRDKRTRKLTFGSVCMLVSQFLLIKRCASRLFLLLHCLWVFGKYTGYDGRMTWLQILKRSLNIRPLNFQPTSKFLSNSSEIGLSAWTHLRIWSIDESKPRVDFCMIESLWLHREDDSMKHMMIEWTVDWLEIQHRRVTEGISSRLFSWMIQSNIFLA